MLDVTGYTDKWVFAPGEDLELRLSSTSPTVHWRLLRHLGPIGTPADWTSRTMEVDGFHGLIEHVENAPIEAGSFFSAELKVHALPKGYELSIAVYPTLFAPERSLVARLQFADDNFDLFADSMGQLSLAYKRKTVQLGSLRLAVCEWQSIRWRISWHHGALVSALVCQKHQWRGELERGFQPQPLRKLLLAGDGRTGSFDGKIESPEVSSIGEISDDNAETTPLAAWDFGGFSVGQFAIAETVGNGHTGLLHNAPMRAVTSSAFRGRSCHFMEAPGDYSAVWFHRDDIGNAGWPVAETIRLPAEFASGVYSIVVSNDAVVDWEAREAFDAIPIFVRPNMDNRSKVALVLPTFSYRAYANNTFADEADPAIFKRKKTSISKPLYDQAIALNLLSLYDLHADGTGVALASLKRPQLTIRADFDSQLQGFPHQFSADLAIVGWLEDINVGYDILTDEILHETGALALDGYEIVITGSHPEYSSAALLDAYLDYCEAGGAIMYLGGNGFYWSVGLNDQHPELLEVRRSEGTRTWTAGVAERRQQLDGADGGIWRSLGRPPNATFGIGFCAHGFSGDGDYIALPAQIPESFRNTRRFFAKQGTRPFGVAGLEIDRYAPEFGSPKDVVILASINAMPEGYLPTVEEFGGLDELIPNADAALASKVQGNITMRILADGGYVFSTGSIRWCSGLTDELDVHGVRDLTTSMFRDLMAQRLSKDDNERAGENPVEQGSA